MVIPHHITKRRQWAAGATWALLFAVGAPSAMATSVNATDTLPGAPYLLQNIHGIPYYPLTQVAPGYVASSQSTLTFSWDTLGAMDTIKSEVSSPRAATVTKDLDGFYSQASFSSSKPYDSVTLDDVTHELKGVTMSTEITLTSSALWKISGDGTLTIHGLTISPSDHLVYGTLDGGPLANVPMFTYDNTQLQMTKDPARDLCSPEATFCDVMGPPDSLQQKIDFKLSDASLHLTQQGLDAISQSLRLLPHGQATLASNAEFGRLSMNMTVYAAPNYFTASVPEPTSAALMGLGLAGLICMSQRRKVH